jgi:hypothetical protein
MLKLEQRGETTEKMAFEIEASLIDFVGMENLSNLQGGHYSSDFGLKTADEITAMYEAEELSTTEAIMLININRRYRRDMTEIHVVVLLHVFSFL